MGPLGKLNINSVIVGGKSGPGASPILQKWVTDIRDQCLQAKVPFLFKQWGISDAFVFLSVLRGDFQHTLTDLHPSRSGNR